MQPLAERRMHASKECHNGRCYQRLDFRNEKGDLKINHGRKKHLIS